MTSEFWQFNSGNLLTLVALLISFWAAHAANQKQIRQDAADRQEMKTKLDLIFQWFQQNIVGQTRGRSHGD